MNKKYQVMPDMDPEQFKALKNDIAERGVLTPIDLDEKGLILDGHHRVRACQELGITEYPTIIRPGLSEKEKRMFARKSNMMRRHLSRKQVRELIRMQLMDTPQWADNRIGNELGIDSKTVKTIRGNLEATSEIPKFDKYIGIDGKARSKTRKQAIMVTNEDQRNRILELLKEAGINLNELPKGFLSAESFQLFHDPWWESEYGKMFIRKFKIYAEVAYEMGFGIPDDGWLARQYGSDLEEWFGEDGDQYRKRLPFFKSSHWFREPEKSKEMCKEVIRRFATDEKKRLKGG